MVEAFSEPATEVFEALLVLASVEKSDEMAPTAVATKAADEIAGLAHTLKTQTIVLHSFAHLFGELSSPQTAIEVLKATESHLRQKNFKVIRTPFGWFNTLDIQAKGHPLSRVARTITP
jgi:threonyl-tRNA synthetase